MQIFILILCLYLLPKFSIIYGMRKVFYPFIVIFTTISVASAATRDAQLTNTTGYNYNYMYPYLNNQMRTDLNPGVTTSQSLSPINTVVKTAPLPNTTERRVVPRRNTGARSATTANTRRTTPRASTAPVAPIASVAPVAPAALVAPVAAPSTPRRVVARSGIKSAATVRSGNRADTSYTNQASTNAYANMRYSDTERVSSSRCLADYSECMDNYCMRENTAYNRCYCSSKLSQIDATYQASINDLINKILTIKNANRWTDAEMSEYWMSTVGKYRGENSWSNLDDALDIDWAGMESRVRGQTAYTTGHEYCIQHLRGCSYMISNLRDAYRSEISRDCSNYEQSLLRIKNAAESIIGTYK